eukprot:Tbor_TRINITY_DN5384_c1_g7::TRINITY_DN5384_c1_g7_i1::g.4280::m.4280
MDMGTPWSEEDNIAMYNLYKSVHRCWIGISNAANRREWRYMSGGRKGRLLWYGERNGSAQNGYYTNWYRDQPSSSRYHPPGGDEIRRENSGEMFYLLNGSWNDWENYSLSQCVMCETPRISPDNHTISQKTAIPSTSPYPNTKSPGILPDITQPPKSNTSNTSTAALSDCYSSGTSYRDGGGCICNPTYSGGKCNKRNHMGPDGQIKFQAILGPINWDDGKKLCENSGMDMGTPWSEEDNIAMYNLYKSVHRCWIGISNAANRREWRYMSGGRKGRLLWYGERNGSAQNGYYTNWYRDQPSSSRYHPPGGDEIRRENSGEMFYLLNGSWNDWENYSLSQCVMCE